MAAYIKDIRQLEKDCGLMAKHFGILHALMQYSQQIMLLA